MDTIIWSWIDVGLFGSTLLIIAWRTTIALLRLGSPSKSLLSQFHVMLSVYSIVRFVDRLLRAVLHGLDGQDSPWIFFANRLAMMLLLISFDAVMFSWLSAARRSVATAHTRGAVHGTVEIGGSRGIIRGWWSTVAAAAVLVFTIVCTIIFAATGYTPAGEVLYDVNIIVIAMMFLLMAIGFSIVGSRLYLRLRVLLRLAQDQQEFAKYAGLDVEGLSKELQVVVGVAGTCTCTFLLRAIAFLWRPITGTYMYIGVFDLMAYLIPELVPVLVLLVVFRAPQTVEQKEVKRGRTMSVTADSVAKTKGGLRGLLGLDEDEDMDESGAV